MFKDKLYIYESPRLDEVFHLKLKNIRYEHTNPKFTSIYREYIVYELISYQEYIDYNFILWVNRKFFKPTEYLLKYPKNVTNYVSLYDDIDFVGGIFNKRPDMDDEILAIESFFSELLSDYPEIFYV
jgi:hypothetical protein